MSEVTPPVLFKEPPEHAVIYVGAASVSLVIGLKDDKGQFSRIESLDRPLPVARDVFRARSISRRLPLAHSSNTSIGIDAS